MITLRLFLNKHYVNFHPGNKPKNSGIEGKKLDIITILVYDDSKDIIFGGFRYVSVLPRRL